jgi:hypothetical protein
MSIKVLNHSNTEIGVRIPLASCVPAFVHVVLSCLGRDVAIGRNPFQEVGQKCLNNSVFQKIF